MRIAFCLLVALAAGCVSPTAPEITGSWGGSQASLTLDQAGGTLQMPCAAGAIDSTWTLTSDGDFAAAGTYSTEAGPVPVGGYPPHTARYTGQVSGNVLYLNITVTDLNEAIGPLALVRGGPPVLLRCL
jgi:hypothetical protein